MTVFLWILSVLAGAGGLGVVLARKPIYSALCLVFCIGMLAVIFLVLNAQFLFVVQLIVYAGAVMVLFVFIIALLNPKSEDRPVANLRAVVGLIGVIGITAVIFGLAQNGTTYSGTVFHGAAVGTGVTGSDPYNSLVFTPQEVNAPQAGNIQTVGGQLFTVFLLPFEITSLLLLVAAIGVVYLTRHQAGAIKP